MVFSGMTMDNKYVQYGCGWSAPINWRNFDASPTLRFERIPIVGRFYTKNASRFPRNVEFGDIVCGLTGIPNVTRYAISLLCLWRPRK